MIADNDKEAEIIKVLEIIRKNGPMSRRDLVHRTRFLGSTKRLNEVVSVLAEGGSVRIEKTESNKSYIVHYTKS